MISLEEARRIAFRANVMSKLCSKGTSWIDAPNQIVKFAQENDELARNLVEALEALARTTALLHKKEEQWANWSRKMQSDGFDEEYDDRRE